MPFTLIKTQSLSFLRTPLLILLLIFSMSAHAVLINEIRLDQSGSDNDEYVELVGTSGESLDGLTLLVIGDGSAGSGAIDSIVSLADQTIGVSGHFLVTETTFTLNELADLQVGASGLSLENSDNLTFLLVSGFTGSNTDDLDDDDDGVFNDELPWTGIVDSIAVLESPDLSASGSEQYYSDNTVGPDGSFVPGHSLRCYDGFRVGGSFNPADASANDTPGSVNDCGYVINEIRIDQSGSDDDEYFEIGAAGNAPLVGLSYVVIGDDSEGSSGVIESVVELGAVTTNPNGLFTVAKGTFTLNAVTPDLIASLNFENSDNVTHLIVSGLTAVVNDDLDADDDGTLDTEPWTEVVNSISLIESVDSGEQVYGIESVGPDGNFVPAHSYRCPDGIRIGKFSTTDADAKDTPTLQNDCLVVILPAVDRTIPEIQGDGFASPFDGGRVRTTGIVTADFQAEGELSGFYLQDPVGDSNSATSDGIFVFEGNTSFADVKVGDSVTVEADVTEFFELTELNNVGSVIINSSANPVPAPAAVTLPESLDGDLERYEGMLVSIDSVMTVSQTTLLDRSGQLVLSSPNDAGSAGRLFQPTNLFPASSPEALNLADENARRILVLDDARSADSDEISFIGAPPATVIRAGDTVSNLVGVLDYGLVDGGLSRSDYRLQPTQAPSFTATNPREAMPSPVNGTLTVASFNVLNFFTTLDERGADTTSELIRQEAKLVSALVEINADVVGLIEVENNGLGAGSATRRLVDAINTELGSIEYDVLPVGDLFTPIGTDAITVAFIYKSAVVAPKGAVVTLASGAFDQTLTDGGRSRQPIAATFVEVASGEVFTAVINHFKSKRAPSSMQNNGNDDQGDGQGGWNLRRTEAATDLAAWLATNPTGVDDSDVLILGDLNAYAQEDPILALIDAGYADLVRQFEGEQGYSYAFGGQSGYLDHALASSSLVSQLSGVTTWHINSDEPTVLSYDEDFNPTGYFQADPFRSSDHDPVIVGLALGQSATQSEGCFVIPLKTKKAVVFCL